VAAAGEQIGPYEVVRLIARGGMGVVYEAYQPALDRAVALKRLDLRTEDPRGVDRFIRESRIAASFDHPNIVTVYDFFEADGVPYIAMEYLPRGTLRRFVRDVTRPQAYGAIEGILAALAHAEQHGVAHRDLKPENVLVTGGGGVKIADFGIAKAYARVTSASTLPGAAIGTPTYMAPEQALSRPVGPYTDLYAAGVVAYELLAGAPPFEGGTPMATMYMHLSAEPPPLSAVDDRVAAWVARMLAKPPGDRPGDAARAWAELEEAVVDAHGPYWRRDAPLVERPVPARRSAPTAHRPRETPDGDRTATRWPPAIGWTPERGGPRRRVPWRPLAAGAAAVAALTAGTVAALHDGGPRADERGTPSPTATPERAAAVAAAPYDFDGDGVATVVAGLPTGGRREAGAVYLPATERTIRAPRRRPGAGFGAAVASADFDRNGYADLAVGAPGTNLGDRSRREGAITILYGGPHGLAGARRASLPGPGIDLPYRAARFGAALAAGDMNGDDYADLAVGAPGTDAMPSETKGSGSIRLLFGGRGGIRRRGARTIRRPHGSSGRFGSLLAIGDVDRDGRADVFEAAPGARGHATYCPGRRAGPRSCRLVESYDGPSALAIGDVTGDRFADVVEGRPVEGIAGAVWVRPGTRTGPSTHIAVTQDTAGVTGNDQAGDAFGAAVAVADIDGDPFADLVIGAPGEDGIGRITVVPGARDGLEERRDLVLGTGSDAVPGVALGSRFGSAIAVLHLDRDHRLDLAATAPGDAFVLVVPGVEGGFAGSRSSALRLPPGTANPRLGTG
jgi:hypothetical protein